MLNSPMHVTADDISDGVRITITDETSTTYVRVTKDSGLLPSVRIQHVVPEPLPEDAVEPDEDLVGVALNRDLSPAEAELYDGKSFAYRANKKMNLRIGSYVQCPIGIKNGAQTEIRHGTVVTLNPAPSPVRLRKITKRAQRPFVPSIRPVDLARRARERDLADGNGFRYGWDDWH